MADFVEICNVCARKAIIEAAKRIINSDKVCHRYNDLNFGVTFLEHSVYTGWAKKTDHFLKCISFSYNDIGRRSIYQNVQLFIRSKSDILNAAVFKYSLHKVRETTLH